MDDVCELDGICGGEMTQILDLGSDVKSNEIIKESSNESHPPFEEISNQDEFSVNLEKLNFEIHDENCGDAENAISFRDKQVPSVFSGAGPASESAEAEKLIPLPEGATEDKDLFNGKIAADLTDVGNQDEELNEAINKALGKHFDVEGDYERLSNGGDGDNKEASVQTAIDQNLISNESCPICRLQQVELKSDLTALCLEYPPYKKIKINKSDGLSASTSETRFVGITEYSSEEVEIERMRRRKVSFEDDQIVPECPSGSELKKEQNPESSTRSVRIGLSKRAKLRPLHKISKLQATDATENNF